MMNETLEAIMERFINHYKKKTYQTREFMELISDFTDSLYLNDATLSSDKRRSLIEHVLLREELASVLGNIFKDLYLLCDFNSDNDPVISLIRLQTAFVGYFDASALFVTALFQYATYRNCIYQILIRFQGEIAASKASRSVISLVRYAIAGAYNLVKHSLFKDEEVKQKYVHLISSYVLCDYDDIQVVSCMFLVYIGIKISQLGERYALLTTSLVEKLWDLLDIAKLNEHDRACGYCAAELVKGIQLLLPESSGGQKFVQGMLDSGKDKEIEIAQLILNQVPDSLS